MLQNYFVAILVSKLGATPADVDQQRDFRADGYAIPVIQDYYAKGAGHGAMPGRIKKGIEAYRKEELKIRK